MELKELIEEYLQCIKMFELSGKEEYILCILQRKIDQKFWRESILFWKKRINEELNK